MDESVVNDPAEFWERRYDLTPRTTTTADIENRATNGGRHLVLVADVTDETVVSQFEPALTALERFDCIAAVPPSYLHVTVKVVGNVVENPQSDAAFTEENEDQIIEDTRSAFDGFEPFTVAFPRYNLFPGVVYAEVDDDGRFAELNRRVCDVPDVETWDRDGEGFVPHATLGQFIDTDGYGRLLDYLETNRAVRAGPLDVSAIELVAIDLAERFPAFETVERFDLG
ncbi:2'-5' RNA ligase family protein [Halococcus agarilyticus]|uniref:2'-5' RNA ligase family protein n=1 Tax=Halococcus agarilyticus TaxID=1232219 RepID=UPI000677BAA4|nr:2'-5' RNA ligase family protein [Halococcus agarilyticus]